jgi:hypothetical protein
MTTSTQTRKSGELRYIPIKVTDLDRAFGGSAMKILPPYSKIPDAFKLREGEWVEWQMRWFSAGLKNWPVPKQGIDLRQAMYNLECVQRSFAPKHEHKQAGVAYLASLWFSSPDGEAIDKAKGRPA